jgi:hypothetical protein
MYKILDHIKRTMSSKLLTVLPTVGPAYDRWNAASWPCQRKGVGQAAGSVADLLAATGSHAAANFVGARQRHRRRTGDDERAEVESDLKKDSGARCYKTFCGCNLHVFAIMKSVCLWSASPGKSVDVDKACDYQS